MEPTLHIKGLFGGRINIGVFGRETGDWQIAPLQKAGDESSSEENERLYRRISAAARIVGDVEDTINAPRPTKMNAVICASGQLTEDLWRPGDVHIMRGVEADGCDLPSCEAFWCSSSDTPVIVAVGGDKVVCAQAGFPSLIDREKILTGKPSRDTPSVVDNILDEFNKEIGRLRIVMIGGLHPKNYRFAPNDAKHGENNIKVIEHLKSNWQEGLGDPDKGEIDIKGLIRQQLIQQGVRKGNIHSIPLDPFNDYNSGSQPLWHCTIRDGGTTRNGFLVIRNW